MTAVKKFFARERQLKARNDAYYARLEEEINNPRVEIIDTTAFDKRVEEIDFLLKRNWFLDEDHIRELLWHAEEDVFQEIVNRISTYDDNVRQAIYSFLPLPIGNMKLNVRDLSDEDMMAREIKAYEDIKKKLDSSWEEYKRQNRLEPPVGYLDSEMDDLYTKLQSFKKNLEDTKKKSLAGKYIHPRIRDKVILDDPCVLSLTKKIETLENEIKTQRQCIEQEHNEWFAKKRTEFENEQMLSL